MGYELMNRAEVLLANYTAIKRDILGVALKYGKQPPSLLIVSKTWPPSDIKILYDAGHRDFGENYVDELREKVSVLPSDIRWHFIGALQSNKLNILGNLANLHCIQTIDSIEKCTKLNKILMNRNGSLEVYIQVNTSGEVGKKGIHPNEVIELSQYLEKECSQLKLKGLMTIGMQGIVEDNPDFIMLSKCRSRIAEGLERDVEEFGLSMGMSADYVEAIKHSSTMIRVGSAIFGSRS